MIIESINVNLSIDEITTLKKLLGGLKESKEVAEKLNKLLELYKSDSDNDVPDYLPVTEDTPIGTIVRYSDTEGKHKLGFLRYRNKEDNYVQISEYLTAYSDFGGYTKTTLENLKVHVKADLQFKAFLNAPKECKWFTIDSTGIGYVFVNKPTLDDVGLNWVDLVGNYALGVSIGNFDFYAKYYKKILVKRL